MTFWTTLRWAGALAFAVMVLVSWLGTDRSAASGSSSARTAPVIIR